MPGFFDRIVYSSANEDGRSELRALRAAPGDRLVTVAGSGARAFDLLLSDADAIDAVDFNVHQLRLAALKVAAWRTLDHPEMLAFLGVTAHDDRLGTYARVRPLLKEHERSYWDAAPAAVRDGILYCGVWERFFRGFALGTRFKARALARLFAAGDLDAQRRVWRDEWDDWRWRLGTRIFGLRAVWRHVLREPGVERIPAETDLAAAIRARFDACADRHLFRDNAYLHVLLRGRYAPGGPLPLHLRAGHFDRIRSRLDRIRWHHAPLHAFLAAAEPRSYAGFSLSDVSSYADDATYAAIWDGVRASATRGARVCERHFLAPREPQGGPSFTRDRALEDELGRTDDTFLYTFVAGTFA